VTVFLFGRVSGLHRPEIPREDTKSISAPQETVKPIVPAFTSQPENCITSLAPVMELELNGAKLRISNGIDPGLLLQVLQILRGAAC